MQGLHSCSQKALHAIAHADAHSSVYSIAQSAEQEPEIPPASLFAGLDKDGIWKSSTNPDSHQTSWKFSLKNCERDHCGSYHPNTSIVHTRQHNLPTVAQCAVHLELLEVIFALKHRVLSSNALDRTFALKPDQRVPRNRAKFAEHWKVKWEFFVQAAAARFEAWWDEKSLQYHLQVEEEKKQRTGYITDANLPPLDVLMIWHSFLLNPGTYNARCAAGTSCFIDIAFPWINVHRAINARDRTFTLLPSAASSFKLNTGHEADLLAFLSSEDMAYRIDKSNFKSGHQLDGNVVFNRLQNALYTDLTAILTATFALQTDFTSKMALKHLWLRSPSASHTVAQAVSRYPKFLALFRLYPRTLLVPPYIIIIISEVASPRCRPLVEVVTSTTESGGASI